MAHQESFFVLDQYSTPEKRVAAWNAYRAQNLGFVPDLGGLVLQRVRLPGIDLSRANLNNADLVRANLNSANLRGANLENALLYKAHLENTILIIACLKNAGLMYAHLDNAELRFPQLENADLRNATARDANLEAATLNKANLTSTHLECANLKKANLENAILRDTNLENADLRGAHGYRFDATFIRDCITSRNAKEPWLVLRRSYTGPRLLFILFLLSLFLVPYAAKTLWWVGVNKGQAVAREALTERRAELHAELGADPLVIARDPERLASLPESQKYELLTFQQATDYLANVDPTWRQWQTWQLILGVDKSWPYWITAVLILTYNGLRILLTWQVSALRHDEELGGPSPQYSPDTIRSRFQYHRRWKDRAKALAEWLRDGFQSVHWLTRCHYAANSLMVVAILSGLFHLGYWLTRPVLLPPP